VDFYEGVDFWLLKACVDFAGLGGGGKGDGIAMAGLLFQ